MTEDKAINIENQTLKQQVTNFQSDAYWIIRVLKHFKQERRFFCEVISYNYGKSEFDSSQEKLTKKLNQLQSVSFKNIDTLGLLSTLLSKGKYSNRRNIRRQAVQKTQDFHSIKEDVKISTLNYQINRSFYFPIKDLAFKNGFVSFEQKFQEYQDSIKFIVENDAILEQYDAVKNYFENVLNTKKVRVTVKVDIENHQVVSSFAQSEEIERIDEELIEEVKLRFVKSTIKNSSRAEQENNLFTTEEYFETFSNGDLELKALYEDHEELIEDLLKISNTKHYDHLRYLSSKHTHELMKLRFINKPFSFVFLIEGDNRYHFIWETLNTKEATYVWSTEKSVGVIQDYLGKINEIIKTVRADGKLKYISKTEDGFRRVFHNYNKSIDGFSEWKEDLKKVLT
ncbi:hypothetical protein [Winogradskyella sp. SYSU M77433]|uniref:hypothetical protein n=1 Tax=Winogradskyella sp. SYSU M77433 TaxID=3042722 RepID=UPI00248070F2|nr:hypothetical protein [Winogradskyella sp. SYSU M77433]MDH7911361.1 hypothetical protein [Winogradskyella sp. SYSU M77433]